MRHQSSDQEVLKKLSERSLDGFRRNLYRKDRSSKLVHNRSTSGPVWLRRGSFFGSLSCSSMAVTTPAQACARARARLREGRSAAGAPRKRRLRDSWRSGAAKSGVRSRACLETLEPGRTYYGRLKDLMEILERNKVLLRRRQNKPSHSPACPAMLLLCTGLLLRSFLSRFRRKRSNERLDRHGSSCYNLGAIL